MGRDFLADYLYAAGAGEPWPYYRSSIGLYLPDKLSKRVRRIVVDQGSCHPGATDVGSRSRTSVATLTFDGLSAALDEGHIRFAVHGVCVTAAVTNNGKIEVPLSALPMPYCLETNTCSVCQLGEDGRRESISPGETLPAIWKIYARDVFEWWAIAQVDMDPYAERPSFTGLSDLPAIIMGKLRDSFVKMNELFAKEDLSPRSYAFEVMRREMATSRMCYVVDNGDCFHTSWRCSDMFAPHTVSPRRAYIDGYWPCEKCEGVDWWVGSRIGRMFECNSSKGLSLPFSGSIWVSTVEGDLVTKVGPDEWVEADPATILIRSLSGGDRDFVRYAEISGIPAHKVLSLFFWRLTSPEDVRGNGGCHYRVDRNALRRWHMAGKDGREALLEGHPAQASHEWWLRDLDNMKRHYRELANDQKALEELFPGHSIEDIRRQAHAMKLDESGPTVGESRRGSTTHAVVQYRKPSDKTPVAKVDKRKQQVSTGKRESLQMRQQRALSEMSADELHARPWTSEEDALLRRMYPRHGANMAEWPEKLYGRKKGAIERRARKLRL